MYKTLKERFKPERQWPANSTEPFPMEGDILLLQFVNTCRNRNSIYRKDMLVDYESFLSWCCEFKMITLEVYNCLELEGHCYQQDANLVWQHAVKLRETLHEFICSPMRNREIHENALLFFNEMVSEANKHIRFELDLNRPRQAWFDKHEELAYPLWMLVKDVVGLLNSSEFDRIKKCRCENLYLDTTKGKNRRWCNPLTCGQAFRMKEYRMKKREGSRVNCASAVEVTMVSIADTPLAASRTL